MPPGCCPCAANSIISSPFWKTYTGCLLSKKSKTKCCCSSIELCMVKPLHTSPRLFVYSNQAPAIRDQKIKYQHVVWKGLVDAALCMPLNPFGNLSLHLLNGPFPLIPSRAAWTLAYLMWHIPRSTDPYIVLVCCLWLFFRVFYLQALLGTVTSHHFK